ncbi:MAG: class I SAM-dependent methyltransferase, partial [Spirochaetota bacterium]|nr:class I SAM-dependent methyltransferase [Spirochaetota bacterium]
MKSAEVIVKNLLEPTGIRINGDNEYDIRVHNQGFYRRAISEGMLGLGESYMDGWWDCDALDECVYRILMADLEKKVKGNLKIFLYVLKSRFLNRQKRSRAYQVGRQHYDVGNELYSRMLDKRMVYTCGYWNGADTLEAAQEAKLELVCRKIGLQPEMEVLDLGCGWGSFARYAAEQYGARVTGVTVSEDQVRLGRELCSGLPVNIELQDYRDVKGTYDRVISIGILEHVGWKNYREYMRVVDRTLKDDGIAFIHTIGANTT